MVGLAGLAPGSRGLAKTGARSAELRSVAKAEQQLLRFLDRPERSWIVPAWGEVGSSWAVLGACPSWQLSRIPPSSWKLQSQPVQEGEFEQEQPLTGG